MADNFVRGYQFDGVTAEQTGAHLEDLVTLATLTSGSGILDNATLETYSDGGTYRARAAGITQAGAYAFKAFKSASKQAITASTETTIVFDSETGVGYDYGSAFASNTFTAGASGVHAFHAQAQFEFVVGDGATTPPAYCRLFAYDTGSWVISGPPAAWQNYVLSTTYNVTAVIDFNIYLTAGDTVLIKAYHTAATARNITNSAATTFFCGHMVGRA